MSPQATENATQVRKTLPNPSEKTTLPNPSGNTTQVSKNALPNPSENATQVCKNTLPNPSEIKITVFASGGGTDFQSVIDGVESGLIGAKINMLIAGKEGIYAIERAKRHGIPYRVFLKRNYGSLDGMFGEIVKLLKASGTDLIVLAGYLTILSPNIVRAYRGRIINIHPALLPKYGGAGMYGLKVHEAVLAAGEKESGCTVHFVDETPDTGKIIAQERVKVLPDDTPESLQQRVLQKEHILLPRVVANLAEEIQHEKESAYQCVGQDGDR